MNTHRPWLLLLVIAVVAIVTEMQWRHWVQWDEFEFFRASRWIAEGKMPFRDYWEHHLPLQWFLFAPAAAWFGQGPGIASLLAMRWAQLPLWIAFFAIFFALMRRSGLSLAQRWIATLLLLGCTTFLLPALEFRVDTLGNLGYFAALAVAIAKPRSPRAWLAFGALMSSAVLANMRIAPLVIATGALALITRIDERRWGWNRTALTMLIGIAAVAATFLAWLYLSGAMKGFLEGMQFNIVSDRLLSREATTFLSTLILPVRRIDILGIALWLAAIAGAAVALRRIRTPGPLQLLAVLAILSVIFIARLGVHYVYHYQTMFLLFAPLAASAIAKENAQKVALLAIGMALAFNLTRLIRPGISGPMRYEDAVMRAVHARTQPHERVLDGVGYAIHRPPAYRYWFMPSGVRMLAQRGLIEPYGRKEMMAAPPAAIVYSARMSLWFDLHPDAGSYAMRHYIPMYRDLWVPGLSARVEPSRPRAAWIVPRDGVYRFYASETLAKHPWFRAELGTALTIGEDAPLYIVPLRELPPADLRRASVTVDNIPLRSTVVRFRRGQIVRLQSAWSAPVGVLFAPADLTELFVAGDESFVM
jgi:hypothetical protein